ncbi:MAG: hypothetical protein ACXAEE_02495, partial [Candidatus Thorarchaeota archaeon]
MNKCVQINNLHIDVCQEGNLIPRSLLIKAFILKASLLATILILPLMLVAPVHAANNQGLEWGVESGDRFFYTYEYHYRETSFTDDFQVTVIELPAIPDNLGIDVEFVPYASYDMRWVNGSRLIEYRPYEFPIIPIGNWDALTQLFLAFSFVVPDSIVDTPEIWSYNCSEDWGAGRMHYMEEFSKKDGTLLRFYYEDSDYPDWDVLTALITRIPEESHGV